MKYSAARPKKRQPGVVRDAILETLAYLPRGGSIEEIETGVVQRIGPTPQSSIRSYLRLNTPKFFVNPERGIYKIREDSQQVLPLAESRTIRHAKIVRLDGELFQYGRATLINTYCFAWLKRANPNSIEAVVTDPPYGLVEYTDEE